MRARLRAITPKARLVIVVAAAELALLLVSSFLLINNSETFDINNTGSNDIEYLPAMPGAYDLEPGERGPLSWKSLGFSVDKQKAEIFEYYKSILPARGWELKDEGSLDAYTPTQTYYWEDKDGLTPYVRTLDVSIESDRVWLTVARFPILDKTPFYPGAQNTETTHQCIHIPEPDGLCEVPETLITYTVQATLHQVNDYYKDILPQYGWTYNGEPYDETAGAYIKGALVFVWGIGGVGESPLISAASVSVQGKETGGGETEVDLDLRGDNKYSPIVHPLGTR